MKKADAITYYGSGSKLADVLGVSRPCVYQWNDIIPEKQALRLERITDGVLKYDPDLYRKAA